MIINAPAETTKLAPYKAPQLCAILNLLAVVALLAGLGIALLVHEIPSSVICFAAAFSLLAWAQMLDHIAQAAHYTRQTAELLARTQ